jgi:hypothetical protein
VVAHVPRLLFRFSGPSRSDFGIEAAFLSICRGSGPPLAHCELPGLGGTRHPRQCRCLLPASRRLLVASLFGGRSLRAVVESLLIAVGILMIGADGGWHWGLDGFPGLMIPGSRSSDIERLCFMGIVLITISIVSVWLTVRG